MVITREDELSMLCMALESGTKKTHFIHLADEEQLHEFLQQLSRVANTQGYDPVHAHYLSIRTDDDYAGRDLTQQIMAIPKEKTVIVPNLELYIRAKSPDNLAKAWEDLNFWRERFHEALPRPVGMMVYTTACFSHVFDDFLSWCPYIDFTTYNFTS